MLALGLVEVFDPVSSLGQLFPVIRHNPEVDLGVIPIAHVNRWQRIIPDPLGTDAHLLRFDLLHQVIALVPARRIGEGLGAPGGNLVCLDPVPFLV